MDLTVAGTAFALIFPVELPDKTFIATLVLATRYRALPVWLGVAGAFLVQCLVAVTAGGLLSLLPETVVVSAAAVLFAIGAFVLWRGAVTADEDEAAEEESLRERTARDLQGWRVAATSFGVLFLAEWGDLSQLLTAGLAARTGDPVGVFAGSWLALVTVAGLAIVLGRTLLRFVSLGLIRRIGAVICAALAVLAAYDVISSLIT
jgi:putative Ca2+/H+ antiporter (TMEM165/GDT1 family)